MSDHGRTDHDLKGQLAECAFCGEVVAREETCGKHQLLTVHMKKCPKHPMAKLDEQYRTLQRQKSGREREIEVLEKDNEELRDALRTIDHVSVLGTALEEPEHALGRIHGVAEEALRKGAADAEQGDSKV